MTQAIAIQTQAIGNRERVTFYLLPEMREVETAFFAPGTGEKMAREYGFRIVQNKQNQTP